MLARGMIAMTRGDGAETGLTDAQAPHSSHAPMLTSINERPGVLQDDPVCRPAASRPATSHQA
jgi:hypothetical protein